MHSGTVLTAYNPDNNRRGMIAKKLAGQGVVYVVFVDKGAFAGSAKTAREARRICSKELEDNDAERADRLLQYIPRRMPGLRVQGGM